MSSNPLLPLEIFIIFVVLISFPSPTSSENTTFRFNTFNQTIQDIIYEGDAYPNRNIHLTSFYLPNSTGRATYKTPMHLWDKASGTLAHFTTYFSFTIDSQNQSPYGDGFAFFLAPQESHLPTSSDGGNLGLVSSNETLNSPKSQFFAVEFDTFQNFWDPPQDHVGIDLNSLVSVTFLPWWWSDVRNGKKVEVRISYNPISKNISVRLIGDGNSNSLIGFDNRNSSSMYAIVDLKDYLPEWVTFGFSASTGSGFEEHTIHSWEFSSILEVPAENVTNPEIFQEKRRRVWIVECVGGIVLVTLIPLFVWHWCTVKKGRMPENANSLVDFVEKKFEMLEGIRRFCYNELVVATEDFSIEYLLKEEEFASVYYGMLSDDMEVSIKRINMESREDVVKEYVIDISRLKHKNLVQFVGWCVEKSVVLIVHEFMQNKDLDFHLFQAQEVLTWEKRYKIAMDLALALHYLHEECQPWMLHRDIKSDNIFVDSYFNLKLGEFGMSSVVENGNNSYMAPEYVKNKKSSKKSNVYSFGVVVLEIASGKRAIEEVEENGERVHKIFAEEVWKQCGGGNLNSLAMAADEKLHGNYDEEQMECLIFVGLLCAHPNPEQRPSTKEAIEMLNSTIPLPELPTLR